MMAIKEIPFNEGEYGHRYARAMAAWAGILAYTGFQYSAVEDHMTFNARNGKYFWSNGYLYGTIEIINQGRRKIGFHYITKWGPGSGFI